NTMRQKLSDDFERLNQFADDLAHELRTPVNILLGKNQVMLSQKFVVKGGQQYHSPGRYLVEGDASSASYFLAAGAIKGGTVKVTG
ncbi:hypothetical protein MJH54_30650, partial [Salmonella enterica subsp. enterica serovar Montevideo]|nr:hypothetical protein [Salmonella enterica subsp. enterica serovar Montevideo]